MTDVALVNAVNLALGALGQKPVADLDDAALQGSVAASKLLRHVDMARAVVLARHGWVCALTYVTLAPAVPADYPGNWRYPTTYLLPGDALRVWEVAGEVVGGRELSCAGRWQFGTVESGASARKVIRAAEAADSLNVVYVRRAAWAALDIHVLNAIALEAASRGAYDVTGDKGLGDRLFKMAEQSALAGIGIDGQQEGGQDELATSIPAAIRAGAR